MKNFSFTSLGIGLLLVLNCCTHSPVRAQVNFNLKLEKMNINDIPGLQSYVWAADGNNVLLLGGRTDGLHKRRPFEAFDPAGNNQKIYVIEMPEGKLYSANLTGLNTQIVEQLQSSNMEFQQVENDLIITGGYAYSSTAGGHITFPNITHIQVKELIAAVKNAQSLVPWIQQIQDERFRVTGGYMGYLDGYYYLAGGQNFEGSYNPQGPNHGPGFKQQYTNSIKKFSLDLSNGIEVKSYTEWYDSLNLHRRDYNMMPQIFPNGEKGFTMFSGVFQLNQDIPWLNTVDVFDTGYQVQNNGNQLLNQYHTAHIPIYEANDKTMHSVFLGGIGQYYYDEQNNLVKDDNVPFVSTISMMSRNSNWELEESAFESKMPALLGASAEYIPSHSDEYFNDEGILLLDKIPANTDETIGYIIGGIESFVPNGFFSNTDQSKASTAIYKVVLNKAVSNVKRVESLEVLDMEVFTQAGAGKILLKYRIPSAEDVEVQCTDLDGRILYNALIKAPQSPGRYELSIPVESWASGIYVLNLSTAGLEASKKVFVTK